MAGETKAGGSMASGFLPGLVLGLVIGAFGGAVLPELINSGGLPKGDPSAPSGDRSAERDVEVSEPADPELDELINEIDGESDEGVDPSGESDTPADDDPAEDDTGAGDASAGDDGTEGG